MLPPRSASLRLFGLRLLGELPPVRLQRSGTQALRETAIGVAAVTPAVARASDLFDPVVQVHGAKIVALGLVQNDRFAGDAIAEARRLLAALDGGVEGRPVHRAVEIREPFRARA